MPLIINGETVRDSLIIDEIERLRPHFETHFFSMPLDKRESKLLKWAKENVIEQILLRQYAIKNSDLIPSKQITQRFNELKNKYKDESQFFALFKLKKRDDLKARKELEIQLKIDNVIREHIEISSEPLTDASKNKKIEAFIDDLKEKATISFFKDPQLIKRIEALRFKKDAYLNKKLNSILIKPAGPDCNMGCTYCFYLKKEGMFSGNIFRMKDKTLKETIRQALSQTNDQMVFGWQGGEPTLMGLSFFKKAVAYQKQFGPNKNILNGLQTNGLLIDKAWASFLRTHQFLVGLSLDGPQHIHDHYRFDKGKKGTWQRVMRTATLLLKEGVKVNALSVVNDYSAQFPEEIYQFHKQHGLSYMQFIPCVEKEKNNSQKIASFSVGPEAFGKFLITLFDLWRNDFVNGKPTTSIRYFDAVFFAYVNMSPPQCTLLKTCGVYVVVEHNGDVYSCDFFVEPKWRLGNLMKQRLIDMLNSHRQNEFGHGKGILEERCKKCKWHLYCQGGCPKDRMKASEGENISYFCQSYQMFFEHAHETLCHLADDWKQKNSLSQLSD